jgi:hypothetical protein
VPEPNETACRSSGDRLHRRQRISGALSSRDFWMRRGAARVDANRHRFGSVGPGTTSAGVDYPMLVQGEQDFVMFWRTLPWDHAPGGLMVSESGGCVRRLNGDLYSPRQTGVGLLAVSDQDAWQPVRNALLADPRVDSRSDGQPRTNEPCYRCPGAPELNLFGFVKERLLEEARVRERRIPRCLLRGRPGLAVILHREHRHRRKPRRPFRRASSCCPRMLG